MIRSFFGSCAAYIRKLISSTGYRIVEGDVQVVKIAVDKKLASA